MNLFDRMLPFLTIEKTAFFISEVCPMAQVHGDWALSDSVGFWTMEQLKNGEWLITDYSYAVCEDGYEHGVPIIDVLLVTSETYCADPDDPGGTERCSDSDYEWQYYPLERGRISTYEDAVHLATELRAFIIQEMS